ncbi:hypothetical protein SY88_19665 [Clostridiales bacterium PH28_bin88]|nr:hypothetical protein SY88_19665 [Clostridiales bacterium PH28_bin88]
MAGRCPLCGGRAIGQVGVDQYYCWDCFVEFNEKKQVFEIAEDGSLVSLGPVAQEASATLV